MVLLAGALLSCNKVRRDPGRVYMPDMMYSRAYETYSGTEALEAKKINYNGRPVPGTVARGDLFPYTLPNDSAGYTRSATVKNPLPPLNAKDRPEAARLYAIHCGICHGDKLDGMGPLFKGGEGPFTAAPKNLLGDDMRKLPDGTMFHSMTYGKGQMGSYASQLTSKQRWMIVHYLREMQQASAATAPAGTDTTGGAN